MPERPKIAGATFRTSIRVISVLLLVVLPFSLLALIEYALGILHDHLSSSWFENEREVLTRNSIMPAKFLGDPKNFVKELKSSKVKVAIFGESSAAGYASPLGFSDFVEKAMGNRLVIHNFAEPGAPFVGFQHELAKAVMPYYDVIVIYAGHNEIWSYLYDQSNQRQVEIILPWGAKVDHKPAYLRQSMKLMALQRLFNDNLLNANLTTSEKIKTDLLGRAYDYSLNSRLVYLIKSFSKALAPAMSAKNERDLDKRLPFFNATEVVDDGAKRTIISNYAASIDELQQRLKPDQLMIVSTIISNDFFPPVLDVASGTDAMHAEEMAAALYRAVENGAIDFTEKDVKSLPGAAHKLYLESVLCMGGAPPARVSGDMAKGCLDLAVEARARDALPLRALPGLNTFIRSLVGRKSNVRIIDPEGPILGARTQSEYLDFFVDFQHPSSLGHMTIANLLIKQLSADGELSVSQSGDCDQFVAKIGAERAAIAPNPEIYKLQLQSNIGWHDSFLKRVATPGMYGYYKAKALDKVRRCIDPR
jgi:hypothetical protein